jgi:hypothetical protein
VKTAQELENIIKNNEQMAEDKKAKLDKKLKERELLKTAIEKHIDEKKVRQENEFNNLRRIILKDKKLPRQNLNKSALV